MSVHEHADASAVAAASFKSARVYRFLSGQQHQLLVSVPSSQARQSSDHLAYLRASGRRQQARRPRFDVRGSLEDCTENGAIAQLRGQLRGEECGWRRTDGRAQLPRVSLMFWFQAHSIIQASGSGSHLHRLMGMFLKTISPPHTSLEVSNLRMKLKSVASSLHRSISNPNLIGRLGAKS
jgi:hypothetical protein